MHLKFTKDNKVKLEIGIAEFSQFKEHHDDVAIEMTMDEFLEFCAEMREFLTDVKTKVTEHKKILEEASQEIEEPLLAEDAPPPDVPDIEEWYSK